MAPPPACGAGKESPLAVAETETGSKVIETILAKIVWGAAA